MQNSSPVDTPISKSHALGSQICPKTPKEKEKMSRVPYRSAVGGLMYAMMCTRLDSYQAVGLVSRYQTNPGLAHWQAVKRIMRYLKGIADYALCYQGNKDLRLVGYNDADHGGDLDERKSTSGYVFLLSDGAISWSSEKQSCISLSTMEAEYVAHASTAQEAVWLKRFLEHLLDIAEAAEPACKVVNVKYVSTKDMLADPLTKLVSKDAFVRHTRFALDKRLYTPKRYIAVSSHSTEPTKLFRANPSFCISQDYLDPLFQ
ncbi:secreted RxLR effector protein 161-like [Lycium ferocissimum]|uniref:secreted RxLR effector protein 161-like n=1 Tax=Lycium ferocissimum TaxID=112874 RepID=UPI0028158AB0|nr:secreted RxLR effector protein 161-like [Lycium ferocissimum]